MSVLTSSGRIPRRQRRPAFDWPRHAPTVALAPFAAYTAAALAWFAGGPYPFARPANPESNFPDHWLADVDPAVVEGVTAGAGAVVVATLLLMRFRVTAGRPVLLAVGWTVSAFLALVLPGSEALVGIPVFNLLTLFRLAWPTVHLLVLAYAGVALAVATLGYQRVTRDACPHCGRDDRRPGWSESRWTRISRVAALTAFAAPFGYAVPRVLWAAGIPVGTTPEFLDKINAANPGHGTALMELSLAAMAVTGGVLCLGLTQRWGEVWPWWVVGLAGRRVPRWFPVGLAGACGAGLFGYATMLVPDLVRFLAGRPVMFDDTDVRMTPASNVPAFALLLWSTAVLAAVVAYNYRTRGGCRHCGRVSG